MYISLYRRYRPQSFSDVVGQSAAIGVVTRAIDNGTIGHAYLFSGPRGCGKTTIARLFAKAVNCLLYFTSFLRAKLFCFGVRK